MEPERLVADAQVAEAVAQRRRRRTVGDEAAAGASLAGLLAGLAEARADVSVRTILGTRLQGRIREVGPTWCSLEAGGGLVHLPLRAITTLRGTEGADDALLRGGRHAPDGPSLASVLARLTGQVAVWHDGAVEPLIGEVSSVGSDVIVLGLGAPRRLVAVALEAIVEVHEG